MSNINRTLFRKNTYIQKCCILYTGLVERSSGLDALESSHNSACQDLLWKRPAVSWTSGALTLRTDLTIRSEQGKANSVIG